MFSEGKYPNLAKVIKAALSIFTAPHVEQSFSVMNNLITAKSARTEVDTYSSYQRVKYQLKAFGTTSTAYYHRSDVAKSPVDKALCYHMQTAASRYTNKLTAAAASKRKAESDLAPEPVPKKKKKTVHDVCKDIKQKMIYKRIPKKP